MSREVDPFVFVAATRYAIPRWLTAASEIVAGQVEAHADVIRQDAGARSAILTEIGEFLGRDEPDLADSERGEWLTAHRRWSSAAVVLGGVS
jgi:hypothetical protein